MVKNNNVKQTSTIAAVSPLSMIAPFPVVSELLYLHNTGRNYKKKLSKFSQLPDYR